MRSTVTALFLALAGAAARAHDGHGAPEGGHWHATDGLGLLLAMIAVGAWWLGRRK